VAVSPGIKRQELKADHYLNLVSGEEWRNYYFTPLLPQYAFIAWYLND
jgi:hypothetical protein